jgi:hypothetical protein
MTLYLIDANVLIRAHEDYYPIDRIPPFWDWLLAQALQGSIKMPRQIYNEVAPNRGLLPEWLRQPRVRDAMLLAEATSAVRVQQVLTRGYAPDLTDVEIEKIGQDPFLIAAALNGTDRIVVTREGSKPNAQRANRHIPDVCATFGIVAITDYALWRRLNFSIR